MWILISFFNIICAFCAEKNFKNNKVLCIVFLVLIIISNTIILGLRDFGVGTDTLVYIDTYFNYAKYATNIKNIWLDGSDYDRGFLFLAYISTLIGDTSQTLLLLTEFFIIFFTVLGIYQFKKTMSISMTWFMVLFVLMYQYVTVNLMKQFCAMSLLFWGYSLFLQKKYWAYIGLQLIAYFFHSTSIIFIMIPVLQVFSQTQSNIRYVYIFGIIMGILFMLFFYSYFLSFVSKLGLLKEVYSERYAVGSKYDVEVQYGITYFPKLIFPFIILFVVKSKKLMQDETFYILSSLCIATALLDMMRFVMVYFGRIGYYTGFIMIIYMSLIFKYKISKIAIARNLYIILLIVIALSMYGYRGNIDNNMVYSSHILGIY